jgi:3-phenylpropionate/trans-cinnamate dioxygenase ferredoxin component
MTSHYERVLSLEELPANASKSVAIGGHDILVCNAKGEIYAVQNLCTHQRAKLEGGRIRNCFISCPLHGVMFDLKTGVPKGQLTNVPLKTYDTRVVDGFIEICIA